jgi:hypothetical protein
VSLNPQQFAYRGHHQPAIGPPIHDLTRAGDIGEGLDIYEHPQYYVGEPGSRTAREAATAVRSARSNPQAPVSIYRAAPAESGGTINPGDWITTSREYARGHAMHPDDPAQDMPVFHAKVPADHVRWAGDQLEEFGYGGTEPVQGRAV